MFAAYEYWLLTEIWLLTIFKDAVIFAPSAESLQQLLNVCSSFAESHNVRFNVIKSQCVIVHSKHEVVNIPLCRLCSGTLKYTDNIFSSRY